MVGNWIKATSLILLLSACSPQFGAFVSKSRLTGSASGSDTSQAGNQTHFGINAQSGMLWQNFPIGTLSGQFVLEFDSIPTANGVTAYTSLSSGPASLTNWPVTIRFNSSGTIDALSGRSFSSSNTVSYAAGTSYHFEVAADVPAQVYSVIVTADDGIPQIIADNFAFASSASSLNNLGIEANPGSHDIFQVSVSIPVNTDPASAPAPVPAPASSTSAIVSAKSGLCVDVSGGSQASGAAVIQWTCRGGSNQNWTLTPMGNSQYEIVAQHSGQCLSVNNGATADGSSIVQGPCSGASNQLWTLQPQANGSYSMVVANSGKCLDEDGGSATLGLQMQIWSCWGGANQQWKLDPGSAGSGTGPAPAGAAFYVAPNGNDNNSGTSANSPFQSLEKAQSAMRSFGIKTTYLRAGTYNRSSTLNLTSADAGETWSYYPPDGVNTAVLDGGNDTSPMIDLEGASNVMINGLKLQHFAALGIIIGAHVQNGPNNSNTVENCDIGSSSTVPPVEMAGATGGIVLWASPISQNNTIKNNYIHDLGGLGILAGAWSNYGVTNGIDGTVISGNFVERVDLASSDNGAIYITMAQTGDNGGRVLIENNFVRNWGAAGYSTLQGLYLDDNSSNVTMIGNVIGPANPAGGSVTSIFIHNGNNNTAKGNIFDLGSTGAELVVTYGVDGASLAGLAGNSVTNNIIISGYSGSGTTAYGGQNGSPSSDYTIQDNVYFNYAGGVINTSGNVTGDSSPQNFNPMISGWNYSSAPGSPVFNAPVSFPSIAGGWGPPGFTVPQNGPVPSAPH